MSRDWTFYLEDILESGLKIQQFTRGLTLEQSWTMCINPRRPGLVARVVDWPYSTFHGYVDVGVYPKDWAGKILDLQAGEPKESKA